MNDFEQAAPNLNDTWTITTTDLSRTVTEPLPSTLKQDDKWAISQNDLSRFVTEPGPSTNKLLEDAERGDTKAAGTPRCSDGRTKEDLGAAMQTWRERRDRKLQRRNNEVQAFGNQIRNGGKVSKEIVAKILEDRWPQKYSCCDGTQLGCGAFAEVYSGFRKMPQNGEKMPVAIKAFKGLDWTDEALVRLKMEFEISTSVHHENLVTSFEFSTQLPPLLVQEHCLGGNLQELLQASMTWEHALALCQRVKIGIDVAQGVAYLHRAAPPILHRDLKPENVLLSAPLTDHTQAPFAKICDFGLARCIRSRDIREGLMTRGAGSLCYTAPEVFNSEHYDVQVDVFSFGVLLFALLTSTAPYGEMAKSYRFQQFVSEGGRPDNPASEEAVKLLAETPAGLVDLMRRAWHRKPSERGSFDTHVRDMTAHHKLIAEL